VLIRVHEMLYEVDLRREQIQYACREHPLVRTWDGTSETSVEQGANQADGSFAPTAVQAFT
jgi:hypothetical protein